MAEIAYPVGKTLFRLSRINLDGEPEAQIREALGRSGVSLKALISIRLRISIGIEGYLRFQYITRRATFLVSRNDIYCARRSLSIRSLASLRGSLI